MGKIVRLVGISLLMTVLFDLTWRLRGLGHLGVKYVPPIGMNEIEGLSRQAERDFLASRAVPVTLTDLIVMDFTPPRLWQTTLRYYAISFGFFFIATSWGAWSAVKTDRKVSAKQQMPPMDGKPGSG